MDVIKSSEEIGSIFHEGKRISLPELNLIIREVPQQRDRRGRVAFIAGKKQGNAVWRNRAKRRMRALYREIASENSCSFSRYDILFVAKGSLNKASYQQLLEHVRLGAAKLSKASI